MAKVHFDTTSTKDYAKFLKAKTIPQVSFTGRMARFPDQYLHLIGEENKTHKDIKYTPKKWLFDYQKDISRIALQKQKYALFVDCGYGKTNIYFEYARTLRENDDHGILIISPLMVCEQIVDEAHSFYKDELPIEFVKSSQVNQWLKSCKNKIGVTNWEVFRNDLEQGQLGALILDEGSMLKSHYGNYASGAIQLGQGLNWKLIGSGTPAPNDRIEYANHAVFLDRSPTVNAFLAKYFINRGQTNERWELKAHAVKAFYQSLSDWSIFMSNPSTYGWKDNSESIPPIHIHVMEVPMSDEQSNKMRSLTGELIPVGAGGIKNRGKLSKLAKGLDGEETHKYTFIKDLVNQWPDESTIIWCWFDKEQDMLEDTFPEAASIRGATKDEKRIEYIKEFKEGKRKILISKPAVLGFGLNLQIATRQVFSSLIDSYERYYQAVKRSNRVGSTKPLNVYIPVTEAERPMIETVLRKAKNIQKDTDEQEMLFKSNIIN